MLSPSLSICSVARREIYFFGVVVCETVLLEVIEQVQYKRAFQIFIRSFAREILKGKIAYNARNWRKKCIKYIILYIIHKQRSKIYLRIYYCSLSDHLLRMINFTFRSNLYAAPSNKNTPQRKQISACSIFRLRKTRASTSFAGRISTSMKNNG